MNISSVNSDLIRGNVTTIILSSLLDSDRYGYDILKEIELKSQGQYTLKQPTLYSVLKRLEKQGLIESYLGEPDDTGGGRRRYYNLTIEGRETLNKEISEYEFSRTILDKLVSDVEFDLEKDEPPFDVNNLRPYTKKKAEITDNSDTEKVTDSDKPEKVAEKIVVKEKVIVKYIDSATGKVMDAGNLPRPSVDKIDLEKDTQTETIQDHLQNSNSQVESFNQSVAVQDSQNFEQIQKGTTPTNQTLSPIMQAISDKSESSAFTNKQTNLGEAKDSHPLAPQKTLLEVFQSLEDKLNDTTPNTVANAQDEKPHIETNMNGRASLLDILAQKEEEREQIIQAKKELELAKQEVASDTNNDAIQTQIETKPQAGVKIAEPESNAEYVSSFVLPRKKQEFSFEKEDIDYRSVLGDITAKRNDKDFPVRTENDVYAHSSDSELKTRLYAKGFKVRPYTKANTAEYYSFNFILSNRINRDCFGIVLLCYIAMIGIMWAITAKEVSYSFYISFLAIGLVLYGIPLGLFFVNPSKRVRANFNFKLSILNRTMLCIELAVIVMLIGFFLVGADVNTISTMIAPIIVPIVLLGNLPLSSVVYYALYRTKKYHIA